MTLKTLQTVNTETRTWEGPNGPVIYVSGQFTDGTEWSNGTKPGFEAKRIEELTALIGQEGEFEIEPKGEYQGRPQVKLKGWPGKQSFQAESSLSTSGRAASWYNSEEGTRFVQERMDRRTALMQAVELTNDLTVWEPVAGQMYSWLTKDSAAIQPKADNPSVGPWGPAVTADAAPEASPLSREGDGGSAARGVGTATGEGADTPTSLAKLTETYGTGAKALRASRIFYHDQKPNSLAELSEEQINELIDAAHRPI
jgi:hypothetical protein